MKLAAAAGAALASALVAITAGGHTTDQEESATISADSWTTIR